MPIPRLISHFLCRLRSIATHRDHFVRRLSVPLSVCLSVRLSHSHSYVSQATHAFLGMLPLFCLSGFAGTIGFPWNTSICITTIWTILVIGGVVMLLYYVCCHPTGPSVKAEDEEEVFGWFSRLQRLHVRILDIIRFLVPELLRSNRPYIGTFLSLQNV